MDATDVLDAAAAAREVSILTALTLIRAEGDPVEALLILEQIADIAKPETLTELDAASIAAQAIRDAVTMREGGWRGFAH